MNYKQIVEKVIESQPWTIEKIENLFDVKLEQEYSTGVLNVFRSKMIEVSDGLTIDKLSLDVKTDSNETRKVIIRFTDDCACISLKQVSEDFPGIMWTQTAKPDAPGSESRYSLKQNWGRLSFGFKLKRPDCLSSIVFTAKEFL